MNVIKAYDFYTEPCQLCISRSNQGKHDLIEGCGYCNDNDTHYEYTSNHPGNIIQLPHGGLNYQWHKKPHPERKYFLNRHHLNNLDGAYPNDTTQDELTEPNKKKTNYLSWLATLIINYTIIISAVLSWMSGYKYGVASFFEVFFMPFNNLLDGRISSTDYGVLIMFMVPSLVLGFFVNVGFNYKSSLLSLAFLTAFLAMPIYLYYT